jgi:hypothetical protein
MKKGISISVVVLSAVIIASCATDRIRGVSKDDLACKTPESKYDYGRNLPTRSIKSNNRKYSRYAHRESWNNNHTRYVSKNIARQDKATGITAPDQRIPAAHNLNAFNSIDRQTVDRELMIWSATGSGEDQLATLRGPAADSPESAEIVVPPPPGESPNTAVILPDPFVASVQEDIEGQLMNPHSGQPGISGQNTEYPDQSQNMPFGNSEAFILMMALMAGLIPFAVMKAKPNLAASISFWAAMNPWKTRLMFACTNTGLIAGGLMLGGNLADNGVYFSDFSRYLLMGTFFASSLLYPYRNSSIPILKHSYSKQKAFDLAVAVSGFMLMVNVGNDPQATATLTGLVSNDNHNRQYENTLSSYGHERQNLVYYESVGQLQDDQKITDEETQIRKKKVGNTILISIAALLAAFGVTMAACGLSCNGMAGLAALTGIGGGALVIGLTIWAIRRIWRPKSGRKIKPPDVTEPVLAKGTFRV